MIPFYHNDFRSVGCYRRFFHVASALFLLAAILAFSGIERVALAQLPLVRTWNLGGKLQTVAASSDGAMIAAVGEDGNRGRGFVWDTRTGRQVLDISIPRGTIHAAVFSPDGLTIATGSSDGNVRLWSLGLNLLNLLAPNAPKVWKVTDGQVLALAISPDGRTLACAGSDQLVRLYNIRTEEPLHILRGHQGSVFSLAFHPNGELLASGGAEGGVLLWKVADGTIHASLSRHQDIVGSLAFSPKGDFLASGGWDGSVVLTTLANFSAVSLMREKTLVFSVAFSPDGETLAAGTSDRGGKETIRLWHPASQTLLVAFDNTAIRSVQFLREGGFVGASSNGEIRLWEIRPGVPEPLLSDGTRALGVRWLDTTSLYYELQLTRTVPFRDGDTVIFTRTTTWESGNPLMFSPDEKVYWRVRAHGFGNVGDWSATRHFTWNGGKGTAETTVRVEVKPERVAVGDTFTLQILVDNATDLAGAQFTVILSPPIVTVLKVEEGNALRSDGKETFWKSPPFLPDNTSIRIGEMGSVRLDATGISVSGALATIQCRAEKVGELSVQIQDLKLADSKQNPIAAQAQNRTLALLENALPADVNRDGVVDIFDLVVVAQNFGAKLDDDTRAADLNDDGGIDISDLLFVSREYGKLNLSALRAQSPALIRSLTDSERNSLLHARRIAFVENISPQERSRLVGILDAWLPVRPNASRLEMGQNFPNPFNPETWIPFRLSESAAVSVVIYDVSGKVVRRIDAGRREAGIHAAKGQAFYWDGRNEAGSPVGSGLYIVEMRASSLSDGSVTAARRRVVLSK